MTRDGDHLDLHSPARSGITRGTVQQVEVDLSYLPAMQVSRSGAGSATSSTPPAVIHSEMPAKFAKQVMSIAKYPDY
jgi:hypothetical protein